MIFMMQGGGQHLAKPDDIILDRQRGPGICNLLSGKDYFWFDSDIFVSVIQIKFATKLCHRKILDSVFEWFS